MPFQRCGLTRTLIWGRRVGGRTWPPLLDQKGLVLLEFGLFNTMRTGHPLEVSVAAGKTPDALEIVGVSFRGCSLLAGPATTGDEEVVPDGASAKTPLRDSSWVT